MTGPLSSDDRSEIMQVDQHLNEFLDQIDQGNAPNPTKLLHIEEELGKLVKNENIPENVKKNLQAALKKVSSTDLYGAKQDVDDALGK